MGALMRAHDWSLSPLGEPAGWPQSLRSIVALMINSRYPMFIAWGPQLAFLYNDGYAPIFGKKHPHMLGVPFEQAWSEIWDDIKPLIDRALAGEPTFDEDLHLVMERNGYPEDTWYSFSYSPVREDSGRIAGMFCACTETTQQVLAKKREAAERAKMLAMFDQAPGFMAILEGPEHYIAYANATYVERMGGRDWRGKTVAELIPEAAEQGFTGLLDKVFAEGKPVRMEGARFVAHNPDGSEDEQFVNVVYQPLRDEEGAVSGIFIEGHSVTEEVRAKAESESSRAWFDRVMLAAPAAIYVNDRKAHRTVFANSGMTNILGYSVDEITALGPGAVRDLIHPDDLPALDEIIGRVGSAVEGEIVEGQYRMRAKDGRYVTLIDRIVVLDRDEGGAPWRTMGVAVDVTNRIEAERALAARTDELEQVMRAAPAAIWISRGHGRPVEANPAGRALLGLDNDTPIAIAGPPDGVYKSGRFLKVDGSAFGPGEMPLEQAARGESVQPAEVEVAYNGTPSRYMLINAEPFGEEIEGQRPAVAIGIDVTAAKQIEKALKDSEERLRLSVDAAQFGIWSHDPVNNVHHWDARCREIYGIPAGVEVRFKDFIQAVHPDDRDAVAAVAARMIDPASGPRGSNEYRVAGTGGALDRIVQIWWSSEFEGGRCIRVNGVVADVTEARRDTRVAAERGAELEAVLDAAPAPIWIARDPKEAKIEGNRAAAELLGVAAGANMSAIDPANAFKLLDAQGRELAHGAMPVQRAARGEHISGSEHRLITAQGEERYLTVNAQPLLDQQGNVRGSVSVGLDITARLRAEEELRSLTADLERRVEETLAERAVLADIIEETDAYVQVADVSMTLLAINRASADAFERIFGFRAKPGDNIPDLLAAWPRHQADATENWRRALDGEGFDLTREVEVGKRRRFYEMRYRPMRGPGGEVVAAYQFTLDVTERRRNEARFKTIFDSSYQLIGMTDLEGRLTEVNRIALAAIEREAPEVIGSELWNAPWFSATPGMPEKVKQAVADVLATGDPFYEEVTVNLPAGARSFDFSIRPMRDDRGRMIALIPEAHETTALRTAEAALLQAQKLESMGQLTGGVAHDFNNLLTPILGALDLLQRRGIGNDLERSLIDGAMQSAERARTLVQRLLAFARRQPLKAVPVDIGKLIEGMGDLVARVTGPQIKVSVHAPAGLPAAVADANQLELAILNLAVNARDAMPGGGALRISAVERTIDTLEGKVEPGRYICLSVADDGTGMDSETAKRAIEPFFSTKGIGQGTGLGLSMAHGLASQLGGALMIDSHPGIGTNIQLWLPATERKAEAEAPRRPRETPGKGLVLLVDDEDLVRASTAEMLAEIGYASVEAASGREALDKLAAGLKPDILITDHLMPGMDGPALIKEALTGASGLKVLIISGYAEREGVDSAIARLAKPFRIGDLAEALSALKPAEHLPEQDVKAG